MFTFLDMFFNFGKIVNSVDEGDNMGESFEGIGLAVFGEAGEVFGCEDVDPGYIVEDEGGAAVFDEVLLVHSGVVMELGADLFLEKRNLVFLNHPQNDERPLFEAISFLGVQKKVSEGIDLGIFEVIWSNKTCN